MILKNGHITLNHQTHQVFVKGKERRFGRTTYGLLKYLLENQGKAISKKQLLQAVWGFAYDEQEQYLRVAMQKIRTLIDDEQCIIITTVPGMGYRMNASKIERSLYDEVAEVFENFNLHDGSEDAAYHTELLQRLKVALS